RCGAATTYDKRPASEDSSASDRVTSPLADDPLVGRVLDSKYELLECLGEGSMGRVYRGRRTLIGDEVAIKILNQKYMKETAALERFRREAQAAAKLHHPNVVIIYDYGEALREDAPGYIIMELIQGPSLRSILLEEGRLAPERAVLLMREICAGVGAAHRNNVIHRDLKPDNIMVIPPGVVSDWETAKVVDFGIAKLRDTASVKSLTETGVVMGTPYYMSPEQCRAEPLDARSDVYSLATMLYEMLAGSPPFTAASVTGVVVKHLTEPPPLLPADLNIPPQIDRVIQRALSKDPGLRQADASMLARELQSALTDSGGGLTAPAQSQTLRDLVPPTRPISALNSQAYATTKSPSLQQSTNADMVQTPPPATSSTSSRTIIVVAAVVLLLGGLVVVWLLVGKNAGPDRPPETKPQTAGTESVNRNSSGASAGKNSNASSETVTGAANTNTGADNSPALRAEAKLVRGDLLTASDIEGGSAQELRNLRNAVYARHGRIFETPELRSYFNSRPWYKPRSDHKDSDLTPNDYANLALIRKVENGNRGAEANKEDILAAVNGWAEGLRNHDLDAHMGYYADRLDFYYRRGETGADFVRADRERAFTRFSKLNVDLANIEITTDASGERAFVSLDKSWNFEGEKPFSGSVRQLLWLAKMREGWRIIGEKDQ
ncbi:MAG TPA: protein kinase, partial [Blastocatellia bacterium]|nr:protein kinase [Blastocatellia bacterium]